MSSPSATPFIPAQADVNEFEDAPTHPLAIALAQAQPPPQPGFQPAGTSSDSNVFELGAAETAQAIASLPPVPPCADAAAAPADPSLLSRLNPLPMIASAHLTLDSWADMFWATASSKQKLCQAMYNRALIITCATQLLCVLLFLLVEPTAIKYAVPFAPTMGVLLVLVQLFQLAVIVLAHLGMARELQALYVRPAKVWNMYLSVVICFAALYFTFFCFHRASFQLDGYAASGKDDVDDSDPDGKYEDLQTANDIPTIFVYFMYFSGAIMTSVGFGDITPTVWYSQAATNAQMLLGTMYHVGVFGLTLSHFRTFQKVAESREAAARAAGTWNSGLIMGAWARFAALSWVIAFRRHPYTNAAKRSLSAGDAGYARKTVVLCFITLFQTGMFIGVMWISIRLVKKINNAEITAGFLIQSFLATALLFGGIYFVLFAATPNHQFSHHTAFDLSVFEVLYVFVHFSLTVMTTTGFGDVYARGILARIFVLTQMLISILYSAVIIGLGTSQLIDMQAAKAEVDFAHQEEKADEEAAEHYKRRLAELEKQQQEKENASAQEQKQQLQPQQQPAQQPTTRTKRQQTNQGYEAASSGTFDAV